jgi:hypothetical protein
MTLLTRIFEERRRVLLPLAIALAANVAILLLAVLPLQTAVSTAERGLSDAMRELGEARRTERQATAARTSKERADVELQKFYTDVLPASYGTARQTTNIWLTEAARESGLEFKGSHFDSETIRDSRLSRAFSKITLQGRYPSIRKFLYALETAKEFIVVEKVELAEQGDGLSANGTLQVSLTVSTYFVTKSPS